MKLPNIMLYLPGRRPLEPDEPIVDGDVLVFYHGDISQPIYTTVKYIHYFEGVNLVGSTWKEAVESAVTWGGLTKVYMQENKLWPYRLYYTGENKPAEQRVIKRNLSSKNFSRPLPLP